MRINTVPALVGLMVLGLPSLSAFGDSDWIVRPIAVGLSSADNLDVMVAPDGAPIVGYAATAQSGSGSDVFLVRLPAGELFFQRKSDAGGGDTASFAADRFGNVFYGARNLLGGSPRIGQDLGGFGGMLSSPLSVATAVPTAVPTMAVNPDGVPAVADMDKSGARFLSTFNVMFGQWQTQTLAGLGLDSPAVPAGPDCQALCYDSAGNPTVAYVRQTGGASGPLVVAQRGSGAWTNVASDTALTALGTSAAAGPDRSVGVAYVDGSGRLSFNTFGRDGAGNRETISSQAASITPHSLAYDAQGNPAIVYSLPAAGPTFNPLHLARRDSSGQWTDEVLPVASQRASLCFDAQGSPLVAAYTAGGVATLLGKNIAALARGDFDLSGTADSNDVGGLVQALRQQPAYLAAHPGMAAADLLPLGDYNGNNRFDNGDARAFADSLAAAPLPGLPNRPAGYAALDQADADPSLGSGQGNFFGTVLAAPKPYHAGDSRGDLTGPTPGQADGTVNAADIDYLFRHQDGGDPRVDLNGDGRFDHADADVLVKGILGALYGDANLDGVVDINDLSAVLVNYDQSATTWSHGDFSGDGVVDINDLNIVLLDFDQHGAGQADGMRAVPEPSSVLLVTAGLLAILAGMIPRTHARALRRW